MEGERDRFGEFMKLLEHAKEDIYFAARDQELLAQLKKAIHFGCIAQSATASWKATCS